MVALFWPFYYFLFLGSGGRSDSGTDVCRSTSSSNMANMSQSMYSTSSSSRLRFCEKKSSQFSQIFSHERNWPLKEMSNLQNLNSWMIKLTKTPILAKYQVPNAQCFIAPLCIMLRIKTWVIAYFNPKWNNLQNLFNCFSPLCYITF